MLLGLYTTIRCIPSQEHSPPSSSSPKTLEQWQKGRFPEKDYSSTRWGKIVVKIWKLFSRAGDKVWLVLDGLSGGDEKERRKGKGKVVDGSDGEGEVGGEELGERGRARSRGEEADGGGGGDGEARGFVNESIGHS